MNPVATASANAPLPSTSAIADLTPPAKKLSINILDNCLIAYASLRSVCVDTERSEVFII